MINFELLMCCCLKLMINWDFIVLFRVIYFIIYLRELGSVLKCSFDSKFLKYGLFIYIISKDVCKIFKRIFVVWYFCIEK